MSRNDHPITSSYTGDDTSGDIHGNVTFPVRPRNHHAPAQCVECGAMAHGNPAVIIHRPDCADYRPRNRTLADIIMPTDSDSARRLFAHYLAAAGFTTIHNDPRAEYAYRSADQMTDVWFDTIDGDDIDIVRWETPEDGVHNPDAAWHIAATWTAPINSLLDIATDETDR